MHIFKNNFTPFSKNKRLEFCSTVTPVKDNILNILSTDKKQKNDLLDCNYIQIKPDNVVRFGLHCKEEKGKEFVDYKSFLDFVESKVTKQSEPKFNPYEDNSGTSVSVKLDNVIIVAADTRHCSEMGIYSRHTSKIFQIGEFVLSITGFYADGYELYNRLKYQKEVYESHNKISIHSLANLASKIMYSKRLFPYYSYISISGFHEDQPYVYSFDCLGHFETVKTVCNGSGAPLVQPLLDSFVEKKNWIGDSPVVDEEYAINIVRSAFNAAAERDVKTGDNLEIYVIRKNRIEYKIEKLRQD